MSNRFIFKPQKGKAIENLPIAPTISFDVLKWYASIKYDGFQIFIQKIGQEVRMYSSDWKEFTIPQLVEYFKLWEGNFTLVGEFLFDSDGRLGSRTKSAVLTTLRVDFSKQIESSIDFSKVHIKVFDMIPHDEALSKAPYYMRLSLFYQRKPYDHNLISLVSFQEMTGREAKEYAKNLIKDGYEGVMCADPNESYKMGKRVNYVVKLKGRMTVDLLCTGVELAEDGSQFDGLIGALILQDSKGRTVRCGTGLTPDDRKRPHDDFIGNIIEISYEQILDTYIQPAFQCVRLDKTESD